MFRPREEEGAAAVETALCLCFVVLPLVFGIISYAYMLSFRQAISQAAAEGARAAVGAPTTTTPCPTATPSAFTAAACPQQYYAAQAVAGAMNNYGMACGTNFLSCTIAPASNVNCAVGHTCMTVTVSYPYRDHSLLPTIPGLGFTLPPDIGFSSTVEVS